MSDPDGTSAAVVRVRDLTVAFRGLVAINELSLEIRRGVITGLVGPNGAGKTTLFNAICGLVRPQRGSIQVVGVGGREFEAVGAKPHHIARRGVTRTFQQLRLMQDETVATNILAARDRPTLGGQLADASVRWRAARAIEREALEQALEAVGLAGYAAHRVDQLSYADQKLVGLGRALVKGGALLLLDEPLSGLDPAVHERVIGRILEVAKSFAAICIVEHSVATMRMIADEIAFLDAGRLIRQGKPAAILADDELIARYFGSGLDNEGR